MKKSILFILFLFTTASFCQNDLMRQYYYNTSGLKNPSQILGTNLKLWVDGTSQNNFIKDGSNNTSVWYDLSMGKALSNELVVNGTFDNGNNWILSNSTTIANGNLIFNYIGTAGYKSFTNQGHSGLSKKYIVEFDVTDYVTGELGLSIDQGYSTIYNVANANGHYRFEIIADGIHANFFFITTDDSLIMKVDNFSVKYILGNHLWQSTATNQPLVVQYGTSAYYSVLFDGSNDFMKTLTFALDTCTIWTVYKNTSGTIYDGFTAGTLNFTDTDTGTYVIDKSVYTTNPAGITLGANATPNSYFKGNIAVMIVRQGIATFDEDYKIKKWINKYYQVF